MQGKKHSKLGHLARLFNAADAFQGRQPPINRNVRIAWSRVINMINPFDTRSTTFAEPIEMLYACHDEVRRFAGEPGCFRAMSPSTAATTLCCKPSAKSPIFQCGRALHRQTKKTIFSRCCCNTRPKQKPILTSFCARRENLHANWAAVRTEFDKLHEHAGHMPDGEILARFTAAL